VEKKKKTCEMKLCGVVEALQGTCDSNKNKGCCVKPEVHRLLSPPARLFCRAFPCLPLIILLLLYYLVALLPRVSVPPSLAVCLSPPHSVSLCWGLS